jgi:hypothetical protein
LKCLVDRGLKETAPLWPSVQTAFGWVHLAAQILDNPQSESGCDVRRRLSGLLGAMSHHQENAGDLQDAVGHFVKVSRSYWPGLFHTYDDADLPRTNNALEQQFGSYRWHERRTTGRKTASPAMVQRGQARLLASVATRASPTHARQLSTVDFRRWSQLREQLDARREKQRQRTRFRRDSDAFLDRLEEQLIQSTLPP